MPKIVDPDERRRQILEASFAVFADRGFEGVSMRDVAAAVGASTGTLYHYFSGKEALFEALVRHRAESDVAEAAIGLPRDAARSERLRALVAFVLRRTDRLEDTLKVVLDFCRTRPGEGARALARGLMDAYQAPLRAALGEDEGGPGLSLILGLLVQRMLVPDSVDAELHLRALQRIQAPPTQGGRPPDHD